jgi:hypothetical protein
LNRQRSFGREDWQAEMRGYSDWEARCVCVAERNEKKSSLFLEARLCY